MIYKNVLEEIEYLTKIYKQKWNKSIDFTILPSNISQEEKCLALKRILETGEDVLSGYKAIRKCIFSYLETMDWSVRYQNGEVLKEPCPFCGKSVKIEFFGDYGQSHIIYCETIYCLLITFRGL